jgi:hypothetical protein
MLAGQVIYLAFFIIRDFSARNRRPEMPYCGKHACLKTLRNRTEEPNQHGGGILNHSVSSCFKMPKVVYNDMFPKKN